MPLIHSELPQFPLSSSMPPTPPQITLPEYNLRLAKTRDAMLRRNLTHLIVYADREHSANMAWLTGFDPRFEEALLILTPGTTPLILVGTECESYLPISPLFKARSLRHERFEPFSLLNIARNNSRQLDEILRGEGINAESTVGTVGWKYFHPNEHPLGQKALEIPAFIADTIRAIAPHTVNATDIFHHPATGLRTFCSAAEIAVFEHSNILASNGMRNMIEAIRPGMSDFDLAAHMGFNGLPHSCHWNVKTGPNRISLASPSGNIVQRGQPLSANIALAGANCCRSAFVAEDEYEAPEGYVQHFVTPYLNAMNEWFSMLRIGAIAGEIEARMRHLLPFDLFHVKLNPGHLIHLDEWLSSPFYPGSTVELHSGMAIQSDVIPSHPIFISTRMEDTYVLAGAALRAELQRDHPDCLTRCLARREFMRTVLGLEIPDDLLPLSNLPGVISPYLLAPHKFLALC
ncbi:MAG: M24 family metallopeptidase [Bryobacteraceae bacterium]